MKSYSDFLRERFGDRKMQKITVGVKQTCPNRDGTIGRGGCSYCNNLAFTPYSDAHALPIADQIDRGIDFFARKYSSMHYMAYFQAYTSTHGLSPDDFAEMIDEAFAANDRVEAAIVATRPDCVPDDLLELLRIRNEPKGRIMMEIGAETSHDTTLSRVNRCHTWTDVEDAVGRIHNAGIDVGLHLIMGLPGETTEMMMQTIDRVNHLPVSSVKIHQLQIVRNTPLARLWNEGKSDATIFELDDYIELCIRIAKRLRPDIAIDRFTSQTPESLLLAPRWKLKNYEFTNLLFNKLNS